MLKLRRSQMGQNTMEMVCLIVMIALVIIGIQTQMKRSVAGRLRTSLDQLSSEHFDPGDSYNYTTRSTGKRHDVSDPTGKTTSTSDTTSPETSTQSLTLGKTTETDVPISGKLP